MPVPVILWLSPSIPSPSTPIWSFPFSPQPGPILPTKSILFHLPREFHESCLDLSFFISGLFDSLLTGNACWYWRLEYSHKWGREARRGCSLGNTGFVGRGEGSIQLMFCFSPKEESEGLGLMEQREWWRYMDRISCLLAVVACSWTRDVHPS